MMSALWRTCIVKNRNQIRAAIKLAFHVMIAYLVLYPVMHAHGQTLVRDTNCPNMQNMTDVTNGLTYLLRDDDFSMFQVSQNQNGSVATLLEIIDTSNSQVTNQSVTPINTVFSNGLGTNWSDSTL